MLVSIFSCKSKEEKDDYVSPINSSTTNNSGVNTSNKFADSLTNPTNKPTPVVTTTPNTTTQPTLVSNEAPIQVQQNNVTTQAPPTQEVAKGMNPPHGQPGHRCEIAVGAPLNSKPATTQAATVNNVKTTQTAPTPVQFNTAKTIPQKVAPGMNPPHGQPGHRCDISVGEPLNSKPVTPNASMPTPIAPLKKDSAL